MHILQAAADRNNWRAAITLTSHIRANHRWESGNKQCDGVVTTMKHSFGDFGWPLAELQDACAYLPVVERNVRG